MINANELRVGNWVWAIIEKEQVLTNRVHEKVAGIINNGDIDIIIKNQDAVNCVFDPKLIEPIELTDIIILKSGFRREDFEVIQCYYKLERGFQLVLFKKEEAFLLMLAKESNDFNYDESSVLIPVTYVHQLQNLYFALTGVEIKIELS